MSTAQWPAVCQTCGKSGPFGTRIHPRWCVCRRRKLGIGGPYNAPAGFVGVLIYRTKDEAAFREECRLAGNAERSARDDLSARWVKAGSGYRELPRSSPKRRALESAYRKTLRTLVSIQTRCPHAERSMFDRESCGVCYAHVESDIEQHRHLVREGFFARSAA